MAKKSPKPENQVETNPEPSPEVTAATAAPVEPVSQAPAVDPIDEAFAALDVPAEPLTAAEQAFVDAPAEPQPDPTAPISFAEPPADVDPAKAAFSDDASAPLVTPEMMEALQKEARRENDMRTFTQKVLAARAPIVQEAVMPPVHDRIRTQTELEMAAGAKMNKHFAELHARHGGPRPEPQETKAVFRPGDYVPDIKKNQGHVNARNL